jgi:hypothetical protein
MCLDLTGCAGNSEHAASVSALISLTEKVQTLLITIKEDLQRLKAGQQLLQAGQRQLAKDMRDHFNMSFLNNFRPASSDSSSSSRSSSSSSTSRE